MPMRRVQRYTEQDLQRVMARGNGSQKVAEPNPARNTAPALDAGNEACVSGEAAGSSEVAASGRNDAAPQAMFVMFDYPVSSNRYWRSFKGRMVISAEARQYKQHVALLWQAHGRKLIESGPVAVHILLHPKMTKSGEANKTRIDLGNAEKVLSDALNGIAWTDDKQLERILLEIADPIDGGGVSISVGAA